MNINCFKSYYNVVSVSEFFISQQASLKQMLWELWTLSFLLSTKRLTRFFFIFTATFLFYQVDAQACVCYLHQGGYVFLHVRLFSWSVCWFVSRISLKATEQFFHQTWMEDGFWPRTDHNHCADLDKETDPGIFKNMFSFTSWDGKPPQHNRDYNSIPIILLYY